MGLVALASYLDWLKAEFPKDLAILAGDVNLPPLSPPGRPWAHGPDR